MFFESSTIHGLVHIATTRKIIRLFWIIVVLSGFATAFVMIQQSFTAWANSPIKTTISTQPIKDLIFPKITVCPPKNTYTNLNYDLKMIENMTFNTETKSNLVEFATKIMLDELYNKVLTDLQKVHDIDRYSNWYRGFTKIEVPYLEGMDDFMMLFNGLAMGILPWYQYDIHTYATSGTIITKDKNLSTVNISDHKYSVHIHVPCSMQSDPNVTLHINSMSVDDSNITFNNESNNLHKYPKEINAPMNMEKIDIMPGFKVDWKYTGNIKQEAYFHKGETHCNSGGNLQESHDDSQKVMYEDYYEPRNKTEAFVRDDSFSFIIDFQKMKWWR